MGERPSYLGVGLAGRRWFREQFPDVAQQFVLLRSISIAMGHTVLVDKRLEELREGIHVLSGIDGSASMNAAGGADRSQSIDDTIVQ
jgi:hypothetical protein